MRHEFMQHTSQGPDIRSLGVWEGGDDFRGHIVRCSHVGLCECDFVGGQSSRETEIS